MSPETHEAMQITLQRGDLWDEAIARLGEGRGLMRAKAIQVVAKKLGLKI